MTDLIFVYGILKSTETTMMDQCTFVAKGTAQGCILVDFGGCPGLLLCRGKPLNYAKGEVYRVGNIEALLRQLDIIEQEGVLYKRVCMPIKIANDRFLDCWVYVYLMDAPEQTIPNGFWNSRIGD